MFPCLKCVLITPSVVVGIPTADHIDVCFPSEAGLFLTSSLLSCSKMTVLVRRELHRRWDPQIDASMQHMSSVSLSSQPRWVWLCRVLMSHPGEAPWISRPLSRPVSENQHSRQLLPPKSQPVASLHLSFNCLHFIFSLLVYSAFLLLQNLDCL